MLNHPNRGPGRGSIIAGTFVLFYFVLISFCRLTQFETNPSIYDEPKLLQIFGSQKMINSYTDQQADSQTGVCINLLTYLGVSELGSYIIGKPRIEKFHVYMFENFQPKLGSIDLYRINRENMTIVQITCAKCPHCNIELIVNFFNEIPGKSTHNQRIERLWRDVFQGCLCLFYDLFYHLESHNLLGPNNDHHLWCLHFVYLPIINKSLSEWRNAWASHPIRTEMNLSPRQLWIRGLHNSNSSTQMDNGDILDVVSITSR